MPFQATLVGFLAGAVIGATGVGAGALMTPLLFSLFRLDLLTAIRTDLWFAALTKLSGSVAHRRHGHVDTRITLLLLSGSIPTSLLTLLAMHLSGAGKNWFGLLSVVLGVALLLTALMVSVRPWWQRFALTLEAWLPQRHKPALTVAVGVLLGLLVTLSSVGAGAIGATLLVLLYPRLPARQLVGTDIAHAVPLTLIAGIGHAALGSVAWALLGALLLGSIPGIWVGAQLTRFLPDTATRIGLSAALVLAGVKIIA
jgi:uncharacterized membrane protein YfcA